VVGFAFRPQDQSLPDDLRLQPRDLGLLHHLHHKYLSSVVGAMMKHSSTLLQAAVLFIPVAVAACGTYTPDKDPFSSDAPTESDLTTTQGNYEIAIVNHVQCEIGQGLMQVKTNGLRLPWLLEDWGTTVTQTITVEDQSGLAPGITAIKPLTNLAAGAIVTNTESFSLSFGGTASANALRTETIQYTFSHKDLLKYYKGQSCKNNGVMIDGDLKIREFIYDKAQIADSGNASLVGTGLKAYQAPPFNTFTEELTFVASYGGSFTPTWKLARISANTSSNLIIGQRTNTNDLIITLGPVKKPTTVPITLSDSAMTQHNARVNAAAIAVSVTVKHIERKCSIVYCQKESRS